MKEISQVMASFKAQKEPILVILKMVKKMAKELIIISKRFKKRMENSI
jgi:hypothetical protein